MLGHIKKKSFKSNKLTLIRLCVREKYFEQEKSARGKIFLVRALIHKKQKGRRRKQWKKANK